MSEKRKFEVEKIKFETQEIDAFVKSPEVNIDKIKMAFVAGGQGGGKIASEFCRFGYPLVAYNTCVEDLEDLGDRINGMGHHGKFTPIVLNGKGGASKDRDLGLLAIKESYDALEGKLINNEDVRNADFVWIVVALGGGTGNGSLASVCQIVSAIRESKKTYSSGNYYPTVGVIAAVPDQSVKSKIRVNVAKAIEELEILQAQGMIGSVLLIDNQKMINDFRRNYHPARDKEKTWVTDGNNKVARIITELAISTSLKASQTLDITELLGIWSAPGFISIGKNEIGEKWIEENGIKIDENTLYTEEVAENRRKLLGKMIEDSFSQSIFVNGVDLESAIHGGMVVITDGNGITNMDETDLYDALSLEVLKSDAIETPHYGFITTTLTGVINKQKETDKLSGRIFSMCVSKQAPQYMKDWLEEAIESNNRHIAAKKKMNEDTGFAGFSKNLKVAENTVNEQVTNNTISLSSLFNSVSGIGNIDETRKDNLDGLKALFSGINNDLLSNEDNNVEKTEQKILSSIFGE